MHRRVAASLAAATLVLCACTGGDDGAAAPSRAPATTASPTPTATPSPTWQPQPVVGERVPTSYALSSASVLGFGAPAPTDTAAVDAMVAAVGDWLDDHLDALQRDGGNGRLDEVMAAEALEAATPEDLAVVTTDLASPEAPVRGARYQIDVYSDGGPQFARAAVVVTHPDDSSSHATLVFHPDGGSLSLVLAGPEPGGQA